MKKLVSVIWVAAVIAAMAFLAIGRAQAATPMAATTMTPFTLGTGDLWVTALTVDSRNNVYMADSYSGKVYRFDASGAKTGEVAAANPTAMAIDTAGNILVAINYGTSVKIFDADLADTGQSLTGAPVFYEIQDIAIDYASGVIYVADATSGVISTYGSNYASTGVVPVSSTKPYSLVVKGAELCVGDRPLATVPTAFGYGTSGPGDTARVRCLNPATGTVAWTYSLFGFQEQQISMPAGLAVDTDGLLYVSDPAQFALRAWDTTLGNNNGYVSYVYDENEPMRGITSAAISSSGIIHVSSLNTHDVKRFAMEGGFVASPSAVEFPFVVLNSAAPAYQPVTINNPGAAAIDIACTTADSWLVINNTDCPGGSVTIPAGSSVDVGVTVDPFDPTLFPGNTYYGTVVVTNQFGDFQDISIKAIVPNITIDNPALLASPGQFDIVQEEGRPAITRTINISVAPDGLLVPSVSVLSTNPSLCDFTVDDINHTITIIYNGGLFGAGVYNCSLVVSDIDDSLPVGQNLATDTVILSTVTVTAQIDRYMAVTMGPDAVNTSQVKLLNTDNAYLEDFAFTAYDGTTVRYGARPAMGDVDNDGLQEIIVAKGSNEENNAEVKVFKLDGTPLTGANLVAFSTAMTKGARLASGDLSGDRYDEVVVGASVGGSLVRVFSYDDVGKTLDDTGIILNPGFLTANAGVNLAVQDLNGDGIAEILAAPASKDAAPEVKAWSVDATGGIGAWVTLPYSFGGAAIETPLAGISRGGAALAAGMSKVAVASGYTNNTDTYGLVEVYNADGSLCSTIKHDDLSARLASGIEISVGDVDNDGYAEVIVSGGANSASDSKVSVYDVENGSGCITSPAGPTSVLGPVFGPALYGAKTALGTWQ